MAQDGFARAVHRVAGWCAVVYALANPVVLWLLVADADPSSADRITLLVCSALALVGAVWFLARPRLDASLSWLGARAWRRSCP